MQHCRLRQGAFDKADDRSAVRALLALLPALSVARAGATSTPMCPVTMSTQRRTRAWCSPCDHFHCTPWTNSATCPSGSRAPLPQRCTPVAWCLGVPAPSSPSTSTCVALIEEVSPHSIITQRATSDGLVLRADTDFDRLQALEMFATTGCVALDPVHDNAHAASEEQLMSLAVPVPSTVARLAQSAEQAGLCQAHMLACMGRGDGDCAVPPWHPWLMTGPCLATLMPTTVFWVDAVGSMPNSMPWGAEAVLVAPGSPLLAALAEGVQPSLYVTKALVPLRMMGATHIKVHIPAHRVVLAAASDYFAALLSSRWSGEGIRTCDCTDLPGHVVWAALCVAYTKHLPFEEPIAVCTELQRRREVDHDGDGVCAECAVMSLMVEVRCWTVHLSQVIIAPRRCCCTASRC